MNYDQARQLKDGGWHWTTMNDGVVRTATPCISLREGTFDITRPMAPVRDEDIIRCAPHSTREEAERHFYDHCIQNLRESTSTTAVRCEAGCGEWADKALGNSGLDGCIPATFLCDSHRRSDVVMELHPFTPGISLVHS